MLPKYDSYYYIERLRLIGDTPFIVHRSFIPAKFINRDLAKDPNKKKLQRSFFLSPD